LNQSSSASIIELKSSPSVSYRGAFSDVQVRSSDPALVGFDEFVRETG
jgi:hypothetical protein